MSLRGRPQSSDLASRLNSLIAATVQSLFEGGDQDPDTTLGGIFQLSGLGKRDRPLVPTIPLIVGLNSSKAGASSSASDARLPRTQYRELRSEKRSIQMKLHDFEKQYLSTHGRKPKHRSEVSDDIRKLYERYKYLKTALLAGYK
eukprot:gnl/Hemi2/24622_TR8284_c0_g2_i1.p2 gnl/Hemi2/24622_TR8284_c0_g2~~gnl/Hemi2/24622_TR8284_c0_g2_i1.p2  ORF type:complete len:145 (-),score=37.00 gnl/Hemi2/24622_TR8284_c0_g2_i1:184-618(-)